MILAAALEHGVPENILRAVCLVESGLNPRHALCGVHRPHSTVYLPAREQPGAAAHALARWRRVCGSWHGALTLFHTGRGCNSACPPGAHRHSRPYADIVLGAASAMERSSDR